MQDAAAHPTDLIKTALEMRLSLVYSRQVFFNQLPHRLYYTQKPGGEEAYSGVDYLPSSHESKQTKYLREEK